MKIQQLPYRGTVNEVLAGWFDANHAALFHYLIRILGDHDQAADALQDTALAAMRAWNRDEIPTHLSAWIYQVATNRARDMLRRQHRWQWLPFQHLRLTAEDDQALLTGQQVRRCLARLAPLDLEVLLLNLYAGWTCREIAAARGDTPDAIRMRVTRARHRFRALYHQEGAEDALP